MLLLCEKVLQEDYKEIKPLYQFVNPLAPTDDFQLEIIKSLEASDVLKIHYDTDPDYIDFIENGFSYYWRQVKWFLNIQSKSMKKVPLITAVMNLPQNFARKYIDDVLELWKKIALYEAIEYLQHQIHTILRYDKYKIGKKTTDILQYILESYSVSQVYGMTYRAINNALRFREEKRCNIKHAANTVIGNMQNFSERAKNEGWNLQKYSRIKECPESILSKFFFEYIGIGYAGFNEAPSVDLIQENLKKP